MIASLHDSINKVVASPAISEKLRKNGLEPLNWTIPETNIFIRDEAVFMKKFLSEFKLDFSA
jgi:tripartite-type tricarboxylate transporter receptor subunit TctC